MEVAKKLRPPFEASDDEQPKASFFPLLSPGVIVKLILENSVLMWSFSMQDIS